MGSPLLLDYLYWKTTTSRVTSLNGCRFQPGSIQPAAAGGKVDSVAAAPLHLPGDRHKEGFPCCIVDWY